MILVRAAAVLLFSAWPVTTGCSGGCKAPVDALLPGDASGADVPSGADDTRPPETGGPGEAPGELEGDSTPADNCQDESQWPPLATIPDQTFDLGPYLMDSRPDSIVVMWRTSQARPGKVLFGSAGQLDRESSHPGERTVHEIRLTGLQPNTSYSYQVQSGDQLSSVRNFTSAPLPNQGSRFVVWGDNQNGPERFAELLPLMLADGPRFAVGVGDHVQDGPVAEQWKQQLFDPARALFHQVPFYAALGNHEKNADSFYALYSFPIEAQPVDQFNEAYYSYRFGNAFFLVVNTNTVMIPIGNQDTPISAWIRAQVSSEAARSATWRFAYAHEPAWSESWSPGDCKYDGYPPIRSFLMPLLAEHGFHAYFAGHTHAYERSLVDGVLHIITGGGGGALDEWCKDWPETTVVYQNHHYLKVDTGCQRLRIEAKDINGKLFDWVELDATRPGALVDQGPAEGLPDLIISSDSPERRK